MPIRINLKEIFPSDPQEINVEKVNFNFNKLLELGIGTPGPIGLTGPQGPAGPIGLTGPQGIRGATWWVDSGVPTTHVFPGLLIGDLYLDKASFNVWRWDGIAWTLQVGISTIINTYLAANGSPFVKTIKSLPSRNIDGRFITFSEREDVSDINRGAANTSNNYSLFLTNFDEEKVNLAPMPPIDWPPNVNALYNSIVSIFVNHADNQISSAADLGRYHLELGSLYNDTVDTRISEVQHNLKIRYVKQYITTPNLPLTNEWINTAKFSLSVDEGRGISAIDQNGVFNFITPKLNKQDPNPLNKVQDELNTRIGPWESHVEIPSLNYVRADGISFELLSSFLGANIGIALNYVSSYSRLNGKELFMLDSNSNVVGTLINDKTYIIGDTNVIGKVSIGDIDPVSDLTVSGGVSIGSGYNTIIAPTNGAIIEGKVGINISSPISELDIFGSINIDSGITNTSPRPALTAGSLLHGEIRGYTNANPSSDTGFLRLSAGAGTSINTKSFIDLSGYSTDLTVDKNIIVGTSGLERMRVDKNGTVAVGTSIPDNTVNLHVSGGVKFEGSGESPGVPATLTTNGNAVGTWTPLTSIGVPVGAIMMWYTTTAPPGWLVCDDRAVHPSYTVLTALVGSRTPDLRGTFVVGAGGGGYYSGGENYALYQSGGLNRVTLDNSQIPAHSHTATFAATLPDHIHYMTGRKTEADGDAGTSWGSSQGAFDGNTQYTSSVFDPDGSGNNGYGANTPINGTVTVNNSTLGGGSHENRPPYFALTYIIKHD